MKTKNFINLVKLSVVSLGLFFASCSTESLDVAPEITESQLVEKFFMGERIMVKPLGNGLFSDGDIIIEESQFSQSLDTETNIEPGADIAKLGLAGGVRKWTNNTIVYVIANGFSQRVLTEIQASMDEWTSKTNIKFKERTNESNYITIRPNGDNCNCGSAILGMNGSRGFVQLGSRTTRGVIIHEFGHTLGYLHEQNRSDRDQFVDIFPENIQNGAISQFRKSTNSIHPGAFDVNSTMIYSSFTFSKNGQPVMLQKNGARIPFRNGLSAGDIAGTNQLYPAGNGGGGDGGGGTGGDTDTCEGVDEWVRGQQYNVGDRVTYQGSLYERDFTRWNRLKECDATPTNDICEGVAAYSRNRNYGLGDKVTFGGFLYEVVTSGGRLVWKNQGQCGS